MIQTKKVKQIKEAVTRALSYAHIKICLAIAVVAMAALVLSWLLNRNPENSFWASVLSNIFAGLTTGLVICFVSGIKQMSISKLQTQRIWLESIADMAKLFLADYNTILRCHFEVFNGDESTFLLYYNASIHASDINSAIKQSSFNKTLPFNPVAYCKEELGYDAMKLGESFDELHEYVENIEINCPSSKAILEKFSVVHAELWKLNFAVHVAIKKIDVQLAEIQKTFI